MSEPDDLSRLRDLDARIARAREAHEPKRPETTDSHVLAQHGWRMVSELVAGLLIGLGIGWGLDWLFGTRPLFLVLFVLLGLAAGIRVMLRTASELQPRQHDPGRQPGQSGDETGG